VGVGVLGGLILQDLSWRWIFYVNVPIGVLALVLGSRLLPASEAKPSEPLDVRGLALLSPGLAAIVYGLSESSSKGESATWARGCLSWSASAWWRHSRTTRFISQDGRRCST
jgi:hypothetical protein